MRIQDDLSSNSHRVEGHTFDLVHVTPDLLKKAQMYSEEARQQLKREEHFEVAETGIKVLNLFKVKEE